jgi:hypothetical protein
MNVPSLRTATLPVLGGVVLATILSLPGCGDDTAAAAAATGSGSIGSTSGGGAGKACGDWDPAAAETPPPRCQPQPVSAVCNDWKDAVTPPDYPAKTGCDTTNDAGQPVCGYNGPKHIACVLQGYVVGDGTAVANCVKNCVEGNCDSFCDFTSCPKPLHGACDFRDVCVQRPGKDAACETPCAAPP